MEHIEEFVNISPSIIRVTETTPTVDEADFISKAQLGDIVVSYTRREVHPNIVTYFGTRAMGLFQGGLFTSIKVISSNNNIIGYGVKFGESSLNEVSLSDWIKYQAGALLLRVPSLSEKQKQQMVQFMKDRDGLSYNFKQLVTSGFHRIKDTVLNHAATEKSIISGQRIDIQNKQDLSSYVKEVKSYLKNYNEPLICSTVIYLALKSVGSKMMLAYDPFEVWPRDFLLSDQTKKICKFIRSEDNQ